MLDVDKIQVLGYKPHDNHYTQKYRVSKELRSNGAVTLDRIAKQGNKLDVGCSFGATTTEIAHMFPESFIYGVDRNQRVIEEHKIILTPYGTGFNRWNFPEVCGVEKPKNDNYELLVAEAPQLPFEEGYFSTIFDMNNTYFSLWSALCNRKFEDIERLEFIDYKNYFRKMSNFLEIGGHMIISGDAQSYEGHQFPDLFEHTLLRKTSKGTLEEVFSSYPTNQPSAQLDKLIQCVTDF